MTMERGTGHESLKCSTRHLFTPQMSLGVSYRRALRACLLVQALGQPPEASFTPQPSSLILAAFCNPERPFKCPVSISSVLIGRFTPIAWQKTLFVRRTNPERSCVKRELNQNLSGNGSLLHSMFFTSNIKEFA